MSNYTNPSAWQVQERLAFIEACVWWTGGINRRDLCQKFRISAQQASSDLAKYREMHVSALDYDLSSHRFVGRPDYQPVLIDADDVRQAVSLFLPEGSFAEVTLPLRKKESTILRTLVQAARRGASIEVEYFSVHSNSCRWRRIAPHAVATDGLRWHVRAWCYANGGYRDFLPGRMSGTREEQPHVVSERDEEWETLVELRFAPAEKLGAAARRAVEMDYGMEEGLLCAPATRQAMAGYLLRRFNFPETAQPGAINTSKTLQFVGTELL